MTTIFPLFSVVSWHHYWKRLRHYGTALLIFLFGLIISFAAFHFYQMQDIKRTRAEFDRVADLRLALMKEVFLDTLEQMEYINNFFHASSDITRDDFRNFTQGILSRYPNYLALGWLEAHSKPLQSSQTYEGFQFIDAANPESTQSQFFPLTYLEKSKFHPQFFIDLKSYPMFLELLKESRNSLEVTLSDSTVHYFQEGEYSGFFLFKPIFFEKMTRLRSDNIKTGLFGTIIGFSNFEDIVENIRSHVPIGINLIIYNISNEQEQLLYWNASAALKKDPSRLKEMKLQNNWTRNQIFKFGNQTWKIQAIPTLEFIQFHQNKYWHLEVPIIGILISALMSSYFLVLANRRMLIEQEVLDRTNELASINRILQQEIHERQRMEEDFLSNQTYLQKRHEALEYLTKLTTSEIHKAVHEVILRTAVVMQADRVGVWFYEDLEQIQHLSCEGLYVLSTNSFTDHLEFNSTHFPRYFEMLSKHSHLILPSPYDTALNQELSSYLAVFHINSKLDIPIIFEGNLLGILSCEETRGHRKWSLEDRHFGQSIADIVSVIIEQTARRKAENALKESEERLRFITQNSIDGIISINNREEIISWNFGAHQMFGYGEAEVLGKSLRMIIPHDDFFLEHKMSTKPIELQGQHKDGHFFSVEISQTRWESLEGYFDTIIIRDITERKEYEKRLIKAMKDAKAASAAKSEFLATISHELRTPLNAIIGFNQCLVMGMDGPVSDPQLGSLQKIENSASHLLTLINNILDWSKIEAKKMELEISSQNIVELIQSCVEEMQSLAHQKNLKIIFFVEKPYIFVEMDRMRIRQVLINLLSNAIKFTEKGSITINLINEFYQVQIEIIDTGIGLAEEEIEKIFQPFSQADSSITRKYGGTGLGLAISKNIIDLHGGKIKVKSKKGLGSTFTLTLPKNQ